MLQSRAVSGRRIVEWILIVFGVALLVTVAAVKGAGEVQKRQALSRFRAASGAAEATKAPDTSLWSAERIRAWEASLHRDFGAPLAVLSISRVGLEVPVLEGTDELTLNRAVGLIDGTARPGEDGNVGIAGHRDGFFRVLKDVVAGDAIELRTLAATRTYLVDSIRIVPPTEVSVLDATPGPVLTLVTCYPFYFVGDAPQRYIVRAALAARAPAVRKEEAATRKE